MILMVEVHVLQEKEKRGRWQSIGRYEMMHNIEPLWGSYNNL